MVEISIDTAQDGETRRERLRRELIEEIILVARQQLQQGGRSGISWRGIARSVDMSPASLYTYFDSLDDVFTAVITESFLRLGQAMGAAIAAAGVTPKEVLLAGSWAYRQWALAHPSEFNLIFTDQIPGYVAPPDGPTVEVQSAIFGPMATAVAEITGRDIDLASLPLHREDERVLIGLWSRMHGLVSLEINHHLTFVSDLENLFLDTMTDAIESLG